MLKKYDILVLIFYFIGCQQFPILRLGGPLRMYEILGLILLIRFGFKKPKGILWWGAFLMFVVSPLVSFLNSFFIGIPLSYYTRYPEAAHTFKFSGHLFSCLQVLFSIMCFCVSMHIYKEDKLYQQIDKWMPKVVLIGTAIAIYGIISLFTVNVIALYLPKFIQGIGNYVDKRNSGFFMEPGMYVLYQSWITLFCFYYRKKWGWKGNVILLINITSLLLTLSSSLLMLVLGLLSLPFVFHYSLKHRIGVICGVLFFFLICIVVIVKADMVDAVSYVLYEKISNLFSVSDHTLDSGAFRSFTSRCGMAIFKDHPILGVGVGNSVFYMHLYENMMGIRVWGETLVMDIMPMSFFSCMMAEQGLLGGFGFALMIIGIIQRRKAILGRTRLCKILYLGLLVNFGALFAIPIIYSLYLWVFIFLSIGIIDRKKALLP